MTQRQSAGLGLTASIKAGPGTGGQNTQILMETDLCADLSVRICLCHSGSVVSSLDLLGSCGCDWGSRVVPALSASTLLAR